MSLAMADVTAQGDQLVVRLSPLERLAALRGDLRLPLSAVSDAAVERFPWRALRGIRSPGTGWPGVIAFGVRRLTGDRKDFAAVLGKRPALRVELNPPSPFARLVITVDQPAVAATQIRMAAGILFPRGS
ncbi:MAG: hypothetical protein ACLP0J_06295 [Solirubrobacteraceae bacterium]|jgi:hypothetical protein